MRDSPSWGLKGKPLKWFKWKTWLHLILGRLASFCVKSGLEILCFTTPIWDIRDRGRGPMLFWLEVGLIFMVSWDPEGLGVLLRGWGCGKGFRNSGYHWGRWVRCFRFAGHGAPRLCIFHTPPCVDHRARSNFNQEENLAGQIHHLLIYEVGERWERLPFACLFFPSALLRCNWQITLCKFKVCHEMT